MRMLYNPKWQYVPTLFSIFFLINLSFCWGLVTIKSFLLYGVYVFKTALNSINLKQSSAIWQEFLYACMSAGLLEILARKDTRWGASWGTSWSRCHWTTPRPDYQSLPGYCKCIFQGYLSIHHNILNRIL
jgi:hypothetical protein